MITVEDLQAEKKRLSDRLEYIDKLLEAAKLLMDEKVSLSGSIVPPSSVSGNISVHKNLPVKSKQKNGQVEERDIAVKAIIARYGKRYFTGPDIMRATGLDRRRIKRALDSMIEKDKIKIIEVGFKRRPTKYQVVQMD